MRLLISKYLFITDYVLNTLVGFWGIPETRRNDSKTQIYILIGDTVAMKGYKTLRKKKN